MADVKLVVEQLPSVAVAEGEGPCARAVDTGRRRERARIEREAIDRRATAIPERRPAIPGDRRRGEGGTWIAVPLIVPATMIVPLRVAPAW